MYWWWWVWIAVIVILVLLPLGYGWGYRGWGPPPHRYRYRGRRGRVVELEEVDDANETATPAGSPSSWGAFGSFFWLSVLAAIIWIAVWAWWV